MINGDKIRGGGVKKRASLGSSRVMNVCVLFSLFHSAAIIYGVA